MLIIINCASESAGAMSQRDTEKMESNIFLFADECWPLSVSQAQNSPIQNSPSKETRPPLRTVKFQPARVFFFIITEYVSGKKKMVEKLLS